MPDTPTRDPCTKPCPDPRCESGLVVNTAWSGDQWQESCPTCHGTGRVPMTTDEMLEALRSRVGNCLNLAVNGRGEWELRIWKPQPLLLRWRPQREEFVWIGFSPADALRAALEAVSG